METKIEQARQAGQQVFAVRDSGDQATIKRAADAAYRIGHELAEMNVSGHARSWDAIVASDYAINAAKVGYRQIRHGL